MLIQAALNGTAKRAEHPAVPLTPAELAAEARAAGAAGAVAVHLHPRDATGAQTLQPGHVLAAVAAVRSVTGLPVGVSTGIAAVGGDIDRRLYLVGGWGGDSRPDYASITMHEPGAEDLAALLVSLGVEIEAGIQTVADARLLAAASFREKVLRVLIGPVDRDPAVAVATAAAIAAELSGLGIATRQLHHGYDLATWDVLRAAVTAGADIRVGLEDTVVLPDGSVAAGNGDLVAAAARLALGT